MTKVPTLHNYCQKANLQIPSKPSEAKLQHTIEGTLIAAYCPYCKITVWLDLAQFRQASKVTK